MMLLFWSLKKQFGRKLRNHVYDRERNLISLLNSKILFCFKNPRFRHFSNLRPSLQHQTFVLRRIRALTIRFMRSTPFTDLFSTQVFHTLYSSKGSQRRNLRQNSTCKVESLRLHFLLDWSTVDRSSKEFQFYRVKCFRSNFLSYFPSIWVCRRSNDP